MKQFESAWRAWAA